MPTVVTVDLVVAPGTPCSLNVSSVVLDPDKNSQLIIWQLTGSATPGVFQPLHGSHPGFAWIPSSAPPDDIFTGPVLHKKGKEIYLIDTHVGPSTRGEWRYSLCVKVHDMVCCLPSTGKGAVLSGPTIKNN